MKSSAISCPNCGHQFELSDVMTRDIENQLKAKFEKDLQQVREKIKQEEEKKAAQKMTLELTDLKVTLAEREEKLEEANKAQLALMKEKRQLEDAKKEMALTLEKKMTEQRQAIEAQIYQKYSEEHHQKDREKDRKIQDLTKMLEDAQRKAKQGSMERQGEVLEDDLEEILTARFRFDLIEAVPKGVRGADVIQKVNNTRHQHCGTILWEAKTQKNWSDKWVDKLKEDQRAMGAEIAVIISEVLPADIENFDQYQGVWVTCPRSAIGLATALREQIINMEFLKQSTVGKDEKMEALYNYLAGTEFRQKIEAIVEAFGSMQEQIEKERRSMENQWAERRKQLDRIMKSTVGMYGEMRGIIGSSLPEIESLTLPDSNTEKLLP